MEGIAHSAGILATDVIVFAGNRVDRNQHIVGTDSVPDISVSAQRVQVAHLHHRRDEPLFEHCNLFSKDGFVEDIPPARASVGKHPGGHDGHTVGLGIVAAHQVGTNLGDSIGGIWVEWAALVDTLSGLQLRRNLAEHLGGDADMDNRFALGNTKGFQQVAGTDDICIRGVYGGVKAGLGVALGRQVKNVVRLEIFDDGEEGYQIVEISIPEKTRSL